MSPRQFADLAATIARHAEELTADSSVDDAALDCVWGHARTALRAWRKAMVAAPTPRLYAEFFAAELPIRVWCTAVAASSALRPQATGARLVSKLFTDLLDLRCTTLQALAIDHGLTATESAAVDRFRRRCERWADVLLGRLARRTGISDFVMCPDRAADFAEGAPLTPDRDAAWPLITAGLRIGFAPAEEFRGSRICPTAGASADLAAAMLASFPGRAFTSGGLLRTPAVGRLARIVDERRPSPVTTASRNALLIFGQDPVSEETRPKKPISFSSMRNRRPAG